MRKVGLSAMRIAAVGVDRGGTWLRVGAVDARGRAVREHREASPSVADIADELRRIWRRWSIDRAPALCVASAGVWTRSERTALARRLAPLAKRVEVLSDVEAAYLGVFGSRQGIMLIAGTGSIALERMPDGRWVRRGGLGPARGDEGSALWIGRAALEAGLARGGAKRSKASEVAALAPRVLAAARRGNVAARRIVAEAQRHLAELVLAISRDAGPNRAPHLSWSGALMENALFRRGVVRALRRAGLAVRLRPPRRPVVATAALFALDISMRPPVAIVPPRR